MALFEGFNVKPGTRSNMHLVVSQEPTEKWLPDPSLPVLFENIYATNDVKQVVIAKGMAVALTGNFVQDYDTKKKVPTVTIANGSNAVCGMAGYNVAANDPYWMKGNLAGLLTRAYVELPLIRNADDAALIKYGAVIGDVKPGDILKVTNDPDNPGKLVKWDETKDSFSQMVAQVYGAELEQEPAGFLKWVLWDETAKHEDDQWINKNRGTRAGDYGWPYDPAYRDGTIDMDNYLNSYMTNPTGIQGIHDGMQRSQTVWTKTFKIPAGAKAGTNYVITLDYKNIVDGSVTVKLDNTAVDAEAFTVDRKNGVVTFTLPADQGDEGTLTINYRAYFYGTVPGWDYLGSVGAVRLMLRF